MVFESLTTTSNSSKPRESKSFLTFVFFSLSSPTLIPMISAESTIDFKSTAACIAFISNELIFAVARLKSNVLSLLIAISCSSRTILHPTNIFIIISF